MAIARVLELFRHAELEAHNEWLGLDLTTLRDHRTAVSSGDVVSQRTHCADTPEVARAVAPRSQSRRRAQVDVIGKEVLE